MVEVNYDIMRAGKELGETIHVAWIRAFWVSLKRLADLFDTWELGRWALVIGAVPREREWVCSIQVLSYSVFDRS